MDKEATIAHIIIYYCYDINMLKYLSKRLKNFNKLIPLNYSKYFRLPLHFPLKIIFQYHNKIYKPNSIIFIEDDLNNKKYEHIINNMFTDNFFYEFLEETRGGYNKNILFKDKIIYGKKNNFKYHENIINYVYKRYKLSIFFNNYIKFNINDINIKYKICSDYFNNTFNNYIKEKYNISNNESSNKNYEIFENLILLNKEGIENLLNNPNYLFEIGIDFMDSELKFCMAYKLNIIYASYIVSLIHNKYNSFIIQLLCYCIKDIDLIFNNNKLKISGHNIYIIDTFYHTLTSTPHEIFNKYFELDDTC